jgi:hypothetical protein
MPLDPNYIIPKLSVDQQAQLEKQIAQLQSFSDALHALDKAGMSTAQHIEIIDPFLDIAKKMRDTFGVKE